MKDFTEQLDDLSVSEPLVVPVQFPSIGQQGVIVGYRLIERIGDGGYGEVWRAEAPGGMQKAVKIVYGRFDEKRAVEELKSLERIKDARHPFLLSLERIEVVDRQLIVVTELADESLKDRYNKHATAGAPGIPRNELLRMLAEAADALDYMSAQFGLAHLDIKPENILLVSDHVKVGDFGLVKNIQCTTQSVVGGLTPLFAAPETFDGRPGDRSDQYSLAVVYQFALTGRLPLTGKSTAEIASQHVSGRPDLSALPQCDRPIIQRALAKDPFDRYKNCRAFIDQLMTARNVGSTASVNVDASLHDASDASDDVAKGPFRTDVLGEDVQPVKAGVTTGEYDALQKQSAIVDLPALEIDSASARKPALVIGLGGCGAKTLRALTERVDARFGEAGTPPWFRMLLIDTDYDEFNYNFVNVERSLLSENNFIHLPLKPTQYYRKHAGDLTRWLSRRWIYNVPKSMKTEGVRPLGRLALADHIERLETRVEEAVSQLAEARAKSIESAQQDADETEFAIDAGNFTVFVVGSLSGGTGGAIFGEVAQIVRRAMDKLEDVTPEFVGVLAHWTSTSAEDAELSTVNACAALSELNHYKMSGCPGDVTCHLPPVGRHHGLFKHIYYVDLGLQARRVGFQSAADTLAAYVEANAFSSAAEFGSACRLQSVGTPPDCSTLKTYGYRSLPIQKLLETEGAVRQLVAAVLQRNFLNPPEGDDVDSMLEQMTRKIVVEAEIDFKRLLPHIEQLNQQRVEQTLQQAAQYGFPVPDETAAQLDRWIEQAFPACPTLHEADGAMDAPMQEAIVALLQNRQAALHRLIRELPDRGPGMVELVRQLLHRLIEHCDHLGKRVDADYGIVDDDTESDGDASTQFAAAVEAASHRNTKGWLELIGGRLSDLCRRIGQDLQLIVDSVQQAIQSLLADVDEFEPIDDVEELIPILSGELDHLIRQERDDSVAAPWSLDFIDWQKLVSHLTNQTRRKVREHRIANLMQAVDPAAFSRGGVRRVMIAAPQALIDDGSLNDLYAGLPESLTVLPHQTPEVVVWCEGDGIRLANVVNSLVGHRPELLDLASRLHVRNDVRWTRLELSSG